MNSPGAMFENLRIDVLERMLSGGNVKKFTWPVLGEFNWALDWFDEHADGNGKSALIWYDEKRVRRSVSCTELKERSDRVAAWLVRHGVGPGSRVLVSLRNGAALWEIMLAVIKLNAIIVPVPVPVSSGKMMETAVLSGATVIVATPEAAREAPLSPPWVGITAGGNAPGWVPYEDAFSRPHTFRPGHPADVTSPMIIDCLPGRNMGETVSSLPYSGYASTVGRVADLHFTRLTPGAGYASVAAAGSIDYILYTFLGPLVAGTGVVSVDPAEISGLDALVLAESVGSVYAAPEVADAVSEAVSGVDLFTSAPADHPAIPHFLDQEGTFLPDSVRWGIRHRQSTVAMTGTVRPGRRESRVVEILPGHEWEIIPSGARRSPLSGDICVRLSNWPETPTGSSGAALPGSQRLNIGRAGHLVSGDAVVLDTTGGAVRAATPADRP
ncbi:AMP-binding protein [Streptomyces rubradiris]|uniref:AMP-binding protein n=1 Tax=Streptomyces rubradiris TaxID=285531 RepID=UPI0036EEED84